MQLPDASFSSSCPVNERARDARTVSSEQHHCRAALVHRIALVAVAVLMLAACASRPAPDFKGRWRPVNHYADTPQAIPLHQVYVYSPSPMDGTLMTMLGRWAKDNRMTLAYEASADYTLYTGVRDLSSTSLADAVARLNAAYAQQGIEIAVDANRIVVRAAAPPLPPPETPGPG